MMRKKGALELSVNTIVIIVIGVALLSLGLIFVKNMFTKVTEISDKTFGNADTIVGSIKRPDSRFTVPESIEVKQGERKTDKIYVAHDGITCGNTAKQFTLQLTKVGMFDESQVAAKVISLPRTLSPGQEAEFTLAIAAVPNAPLSTGNTNDPAYSVVAKCGGTEYDSSAFIIEVKKGGGLFS